jgi:hypothetical protein
MVIIEDRWIGFENLSFKYLTLLSRRYAVHRVTILLVSLDAGVLEGGWIRRLSEQRDSAKAALGGAQEVERNTEAIKLPLFRAAVGLWKKMPGWAASGSEGVLDLKGAAENFDPSAYKPAFKGGIEAGKVKLEFSKKGVDALVFYTRLKGQTAWRRLAVDTHSPYYDTAPLAVAGVPEVREYMARGMVGDEEIGLDSDIVSVTFAG